MWAGVVAAAVPFLPPLALVAAAIPLAAGALSASLTVDPERTRIVAAATAAIMVWQFGWLLANGGDRVEVLAAAVIVITGIATGLVMIRSVRNTIMGDTSRYESLFNGVPVGIFRSTRDGRIEAANLRLVEILGFPDLPTLLAANAADLFFDSTDREWAINSIDSGAHEEILFRMKRNDGSLIWVRETTRTLLDDRGAVIAYEGVLEDVTERTEAEQSALQADTRFAAVFDAAPIGMAIADVDGTFQRVNKAFSELLGRSSESLMGVNWRSLTPPEDESSSSEPVQQLKPGGTVDYERRYYPASGEIRWGRVTISMFEEGPDARPRLVVQLADITAQKDLQQTLEQTVRSKDEFIASVSHELRTPLTAVLGLSRELADSPASFSEEESQELLRLVAEQSADVAHIVEDLLVATRADMGALAITLQVVDLGRELDQALKECHHLMGSKSVAIELPEQSAYASADPARLRQIVRNLITNAFRYGGDQVVAEARSIDGEARLAVRDNGKGLPKEEWERIFDAYYRAHSPTNTVPSIGLGLAVSKRLAQAMNGDLTYRYESGQSVFELVLPRAD